MISSARVIPRHQMILFWVLLGIAILMAAILIRLRERAHDRMKAEADKMPLSAPDAAPGAPVNLLLANDATGSLDTQEMKLALPENATAKARVLLQKLLETYADPHSTHSIAATNGGAIAEVFLMPLPRTKNGTGGGLLAVVNLTGGFVTSHPSGIQPEMLTLLSMIGTLHANLPEITQVRFLVDGQPRDTLAGHADLTRVYLASDSGVEVHP